MQPSIVDRFTAYMLNANDRGPDFIGQPDLLAMTQTPMAPLVPFNGKAPTLIEADVTTVPPLAGVAPGGNVLPVQNIEADLRQLRAEMPFLPIIKRPQRTRSLFLAANVAQDVEILTSDALFRFLALPSAAFYVNFSGRAVTPTTGAGAETGVIHSPLGMIQQISVVSPTADTIVTMEFIGKVAQQG
jgi:hypothetical protein